MSLVGLMAKPCVEIGLLTLFVLRFKGLLWECRFLQNDWLWLYILNHNITYKKIISYVWMTEKVYAAMIRDKKVLLVDNDGTWDLPSVSVNSGENLLEALSKQIWSPLGGMKDKCIMEYQGATIYVSGLVSGSKVGCVYEKEARFFPDSRGNMLSDMAKEVIREAAHKGYLSE